MILKDYLEIFSRRKWSIIITTSVVLIIVAVGLLIIPPKYQATTKLRITTATSGGIDYVQYDVTYTERLMQTYTEIAESGPVTVELIKRLNSTERNLPIIKVELIPNTELLAITAEHKDANAAMQAANTLADILIERSNELFSEYNKESVTIMEPASLPTVPAKPNKPLFLVLGLLVGLIGGVGLAFAIESLDTILYSTYQVTTASKLPVLGDIPEFRYDTQNGDLLIDNALHAEAFRRLRTNIFFTSKDMGSRSLLLTSAIKGDGKTTLITNLAISIAKTGRKILVIDADFRNPNLHDYFEVDNSSGLSDILNGRGKFKDLVQNTNYKGVHILPTGTIPEDPAELLGVPAMSTLLDDVKEDYDIVMIDVAGSYTVTDPAVIAPFVDQVVFVVRLGYVRRGALESALYNLNNVKANIVGVVVNRTKRGVGTKVDSLPNNHSM